MAVNSNKRESRISIGYNNIIERKIRENVSGGTSAAITLTLSLTLYQTLSIIISSQRTPKSINIIDILTTIFI